LGSAGLRHRGCFGGACIGDKKPTSPTLTWLRVADVFCLVFALACFALNPDLRPLTVSAAKLKFPLHIRLPVFGAVPEFLLVALLKPCQQRQQRSK